MKGSVIKASLMGGILFGCTASLPLLDICMCIWGLPAGAFAAWALMSDSQRQASVLRGSLAGFMAGGLAGLIVAPLGSQLRLWLIGEQAMYAQARQAAEMAKSFGSQMSPEMLEAFIRGAQFLEFNIYSVITMLFSGLAYSLMGLFAGVLTALVLRRPAPVAAERTVDAPPEGQSGPVVLFGEGATGSRPETAAPAPWDDLPADDGPEGEGEIPREELPKLPPPPEDGDRPKDS